MAMTRALAFVDSGVADIPVLLGNLRPEIEAIVLDASVPAPAQIAAALAARPAPGAIHILAHGRPGEVSFAAGALSQATLPEHAADLARIGRALAGGKLHLWSCRTAQGATGSDFTTALAAAAGAPVAAASGLVGAAERGGCWTLDARVGDDDDDGDGDGDDEIAGIAPLTAAGIAAYSAVLETKTWVGGDGPNPWGNADNWDPPGVPQDGDDVVVDKVNSFPSIEADTAVLSSLQVTTPVLIAGFTLDVSGGPGITLNGTGLPGDSTGTIGGFGTILGDIGGTGRITTLNGDLTLAGTVSSGVALQIALDTTLRIAGTATTASAIMIYDAHQTLAVDAGAELTITAAEAISTGRIAMAGGTLNDPAGLTIGTGAVLSGFGAVTADIRSGTGTITAVGGPLVLSGTVESGNSFTIDTNTFATLKFAGSATLGSAIAISSANQTLEIGTGGDVTIGVAESITNGRIVMSGGTLADPTGVTIGKKATLSGYGTVAADVTVNGGRIAVSTGTLSIGGTVHNQGTVVVDAVGQLGAATLSADALDNTGGILSIVGDAARQATVSLASTAGLSTQDGLLAGSVKLSGNALLQFAGDTIDTIASGASLWLDGAAARVAVAGATDGNSALDGLADNQGTLTLSGGAALTLAGSLANRGQIAIDGGTLEIYGDLGMARTSSLTLSGGGTFVTGASTTLTKTGDGTTSIIDLQGQSFDNKDRIVVESGSLQFTGTEGSATPELTGAGLIQGEVSLDGSNVLTITPTGQAVGATHVFHFYHTDLKLAYTDIVADDGSHAIAGGNRRETLTGGAVDDVIVGGKHGDTLQGLAGDDRLYGHAGGDALEGGDGNDRLDGGTAADTMAGGAGNDTYYVDNARDRVVEATGDGKDIVFTTVDYTLGAHQEIEAMRVSGSAGLALTGNEFDDHLIGGAGADTLHGEAGRDLLQGLAGNDTLDGGTGNDRLEGGAGADVFRFDTRFIGVNNVDTIADFEAGTDSIALDHTVFPRLAPGPLDASAFAIDHATGSGPQIVYDSTTGALLYDANGAGAGGATTFARVTGAPTLTASSFTVV